MDNLYFSQGDKLLIDGKECIVLGSINFLNKADNCTWTEYKLRSTRENKIYWLSVDTTYDEYAIYEQCRYSNEFTQENILNAGYKKADYGRAQVREYSGNVDVDIGEWVEFSEFEDFSEERIISIESWEDETEYSKGYYLDKNQISLINNGNYNYEDNYNNDSNDYYEVSHTSFSSNFKGHEGIIASILILIIIGIFGIKIFHGIFSGNNQMKKYIDSNSNYSYSTSITSDLNNEEKANVYTTNLSVEEAAKDIINGIKGNTEDVQENTEDSTVAILTSKEYCLVYESETGETLIQISSRLYTYTSNNYPYNSRSSTRNYYRNFYYSRGYYSDSSTYKKYTSSYDNYDGSTIITNSSDKYKSYSDSVRQSSTSSRSSSGGGTSFGK